MKNGKRFKALLMAACLGLTLMVGCGEKEEKTDAATTETTEATQAGGETTQTESTDTQEVAEIDTSEHVVLTMYCIGDEGGIYAEDHLKKVNEVLTAKINAEIEPVMVSWGDYKTKLPMVWAGGESYDLTFASNWTGYFVEGEKGAFMDITDLFPMYAPKTYADYTEKGYLEYTKINDRLYMVPNDKPDFTTYIYNYREDLRKKYNCPEIVDQESLEAYLAAIKENEPSMVAYANNATDAQRFQMFLNEQNWSRPLDGGVGVLVYDLNDPTKVFNVTETPQYAEFVKESEEFYNNGYWSQSIMAETAASKDLFLGGKAGLYLGNVSNSNGEYMNMTAQNPEWEIGYYSSDLKGGQVELVAPSNNGMAIGAYSKNPERALMFIELMYTDQELYDVVMHGLEGITYEKDEALKTKWIPEGVNAADIALKNLGMGFGTQKYDLGSLNDSTKVYELKKEFEYSGVFPALSGFAMKQDAISAELAAIKSVVDEYKIPLDKGVTSSVEGLEVLKQKLKDAGVEKVLEEINSQITSYLAK